jgi:REP element-mobilizing transposase RayT
VTDDDREQHHRRSIRLKDYDYAQPGAYFVTVCTQERACLFGHVVNGEMRLNDAGQMVREEWFSSATIRPYVRFNENELVVMPNHMHAIIWIVSPTVGATGGSPESSRTLLPTGESPVSSCVSLPNGVVRISDDDAVNANGRGVWPYDTQDIPGVGATGGSPETSCTSSPDGGSPTSSPNGPKHGSIGAIMAGFKSVTAKRINQMRGTPGTKVWQRNYHEHVIRDEASLDAIRQYIMGNPARWAEDPEDPAGIVDGEPVRAIGRSTNARMTVDARAIGRSPLPDNTDINGGVG